VRGDRDAAIAAASPEVRNEVDAVTCVARLLLVQLPGETTWLSTSALSAVNVKSMPREADLTLALPAEVNAFGEPRAVRISAVRDAKACRHHVGGLERQSASFGEKREANAIFDA